jgi:hypothetical protein
VIVRFAVIAQHAGNVGKIKRVSSLGHFSAP